MAARTGANARTRPGRGLRALAVRRPLTAFLVLSLPLGWVVLSVPALLDAGILPGGPVPAEPFALALTLLVLLPAALWVTSVADGRSGVRALLRRTVRWRFGAGWWAVVLLALPVATVAIGAALGRPVRTTDLGSVLVEELFSLVVAVLVINLWEETVWAGFFQTRLERRRGLVGAALLTAVPFAGVHLPLLFGGHPTTSSVLIGLAALVVSAPLLRLLIGVVLRGTAGSVLAVAVLHASWNASSGEDGVADDLLAGGQPVVFALLAVLLVTVGAVLLLRARLRTPVPPGGTVTDGG